MQEIENRIRQGAVRSDPFDSRDLFFTPPKIQQTQSTTSETASKSGVDYSPEVVLVERTPISDQGPTSTCAANAYCDALETLMPDPVVQLSREFAYYNSRRSHGEEGVDGGTYLRNMFAAGAKLGCSPEDLWPFDVNHINERPPVCAYEAGYDYRIKAYYRIATTRSSRGDDIEAAVRMGHPVVLSMQVGKPFSQYTRGSTELVWHAPTHPIGLHAMVVVGVRRNSVSERQFKLRNSWGTAWGDGGYAWAAEDWLTDPFTSDLWVPTFVPPIPQPSHAPASPLPTL